MKKALIKEQSFQFIPLLLILVVLVITGMMVKSDIVYKFDLSFDSIFYKSFIFLTVSYLYVTRLGSVKYCDKVNLSILFLLLVLCVTYSLVSVTAAQSFYYLFLFSIIAILQFSLFSRQDAFLVLPAISFLIFVIPIWVLLKPLLVLLSSFMVDIIIGYTDIEYSIRNNIITLSAGKIIIADGCSGINYLVVTLALTFFIIFTSSIKYLHAIIFVAFSVILALAFNWFRISLIILVAHESEMQSRIVYDHESLGWLLYFFVVAVLVVITRKLHARQIISINNFNRGNNIPWIKISLIILILTTGTISMSLLPQNLNMPDDQALQINGFELYEKKINSQPGFKLQKKFKSGINREVTVTESVNWRTNKGEELIPDLIYFNNDEMWINVEKIKIDLNGRNYFLSKQEHIVSGENRLKTSVLFLNDLFFNSYYLAKIIQIPSIVMKNNIFRYYEIHAGCNEFNCETLKLEIKDTLQTLVNALEQKSQRQQARHAKKSRLLLLMS